MAIKCHLDDLPDCVLLKIFKHLSSKVDIWRARNVCIRWYNLLVDGELWRVSDLSSFKFDNIILMEEIRKSISLNVLQYLEIHRKVITMDVLSVILETANQLYGLRLYGCSVQPGSIQLPYVLNAPYKLKFLDMRFCKGNLGFMENVITQMGSTINVLGLSNSFSRLQNINGQFFLHHLPSLRVLECNDCTWINDEIVSLIGNHCPHLESFNVTKCLNIQGRTLNELLDKCKHLKTLILRRTNLREEEVVKPKWSNLKITELDISCCYHLNEDSVNKIVGSLAGQLEYLCCAVNDELIAQITEIKKPLKCLELRRRHYVNLPAIVEFITTCEQMEVLDISLVPIEHVFFKVMLPLLPNLRWFSIAGHEILNTRSTLELISEFNPKIEEFQINFYQAAIDKSLVESLHNFLLACSNLKKICIEGSYMDSIVQQVKEDLKTDPRFEKVSAVFCKASEFEFPSAQYSINKIAKKFASKPASFNFNRIEKYLGNKST